MEPAYEEVATALEGEMNVARVDVPANRDLGTRFEIKGFPQIKLLSKGKVYDYTGKRKAEDIINFARGGYEIHSPEDVPPAMGIFGEVMYVFRHAYKKAGADLKSGDYFTIDVFLTFLPFLFAALIVMVMVIPMPKHPEQIAMERRRTERQSEAPVRPSEAAPATSESDAPYRRKND
jgi:hypothetical protein